MSEPESIKVKFIKLWPFYILQSLYASTALGVFLWLIGKENMVAVSALAASSFIVFALPKSVSANTRNVIGGHLTGLTCGIAFMCVPLPFEVVCSLAVGIAIFLMVALDFEHPPAVGTALAVVIHQVGREEFFVILIGAIGLSLVHHILRNHLRDLV